MNVLYKYLHYDIGDKCYSDFGVNVVNSCTGSIKSEVGLGVQLQ